MFKKITTFMLVAALMVAFAIPAKSGPPRTDKKQTVKTELVKSNTYIETKTAAEKQPVKTATLADVPKVNPIKISEVNRPPGAVSAKANDARLNYTTARHCRKIGEVIMA